jgi:hypothetical protein
LSGLTNFLCGRRRTSIANPARIIGKVEYGNVALTAAEVGLLHAFGWATLPQYVYAGGAGPQHSTDFSSASGWYTAGTSTISGGKLNMVSGDLAYATGNSSALVKGSPTSFTITVDSITAGSAQYFNGGSYVSFATTAGTYTVAFTPTASTAQMGFKAVGGNFVADDFSMFRYGLAGSWDFNTGAGYQQRDLSGAGNRMTLTTTGVSRLNPGDLLQVRATVAHGTSGNVQINGQAILPDVGWRLNSIVAESSTSVTIYVGKVSAGAQLVASVALTANVPKDLTIVAGASVPTTVNAWSNASALADIIYTLTYVRSDIT